MTKLQKIAIGGAGVLILSGGIAIGANAINNKQIAEDQRLDSSARFEAIVQSGINHNNRNNDCLTPLDCKDQVFTAFNRKLADLRENVRNTRANRTSTRDEAFRYIIENDIPCSH
jgi:hypothetical protein